MPRFSLIAASTLLSAACLFTGVAPAHAAVVADPITYSAPGARIGLTAIGQYETGILGKSAAEIVAWYGPAKRMLVVNAAKAEVEVLDASNPAKLTKLFSLQTTGVRSDDGSIIPSGAVANSVAVRDDGLGVVAVESDVKTDPGWVVFFDARADGRALGAVRVGALPDMLTFTPDGKQILVANEGEPADDYSSDPEGSISIIKAPPKVRAGKQNQVKTADFHAFENGRLPEGVRIFGPQGVPGVVNPVSANLEPEYITVDARSKRAYVTLQENNAIAEINLDSAKVVAIRPLGTTTAPFDASDKDKRINIASWPVQRYLLPDAIASYSAGGTTYLVTANEGDTRDWSGFSEEARVKDLTLCANNPAKALQSDAQLGRLKVTTTAGKSADGSCYEKLYGFGGRSFSILTTDGRRVFDSGDAFERITAAAIPAYFNSDHGETKFDSRSDDKGPEPEGVAIGEVGGRTYAFIGLERVGGVMVYDITNPVAPTFVTYVNNRDFSQNMDAGGNLAKAGDLGPEGLTFIPAATSPTGRPMLAVANEVSGTTTLFAITTA